MIAKVGFISVFLIRISSIPQINVYIIELNTNLNRMLKK